MNSFQNTWRPLNSTVISNCFIPQVVNPSLLGAANLKKTNATYYYEVTILSYPESLDKLSFGYIGLDHCVDDLRLISKQESLLFHYNGEVSINQNCVNFFHDGFKTNDVIGCGLEIGEENKGFFTCNSELIFSFSNFCRNDMHYYPALFCDGDKDTITFESNFGEMSFEYYNQNIIDSIDNINNEINADDTELLYADDCVLYAESEAQLQDLVQAYNTAAKDFGQQVSETKTKVMVVQAATVGAVTPPYIRLNPNEQVALQVVTEFSYLGSIDSRSGDTSIELTQRIARMRGAYFRLQGRVFENNALSLAPKLHLYKTFIVPVALYGCATWDLSPKQVRLLDQWQYRLLRRILRQHVPSPVPPKQTSYIDLLDVARSEGSTIIYSMETMIYFLTLRYLGHIERSNLKSLVRRTLHGHLSNKATGVFWGRHHYKLAASRALQAFQLHAIQPATTDIDQPWITACRDNSPEGKTKWAQLIRNGAETHDALWRRQRHDRTAAHTIATEATGTVPSPTDPEPLPTNSEGPLAVPSSPTSERGGVPSVPGPSARNTMASPPAQCRRSSDGKRKRTQPPLPRTHKRNQVQKRRHQEPQEAATG